MLATSQCTPGICPADGVIGSGIPNADNGRGTLLPHTGLNALGLMTMMSMKCVNSSRHKESEMASTACLVPA